MAGRPAVDTAGETWFLVRHRYRWAIIALWFVAMFEAAFHRFAISPLVPTLTKEFPLSYTALGALTSAYFLAYAALQLPAGILADRFGPRRLLLFSLITLTVGVLLFPFIQSYEMALGLRVLIGLGAAAVWPCGVKLMYGWFPKGEHSLVTGIAGAGAPVSDLAALWLLPRLAEPYGWRVGYFIAALTAPLVLLVCWRYLRLPPDGGDQKPGPSALLGNLRLVFGNRRLWAVSVALLLYFGGYVGVLSWLPTYYFQELGYAKVEASFLAGFATLVLPLGMPLIGLIADRIGRRVGVFAVLALGNAALLVALPILAPRTAHSGLIVLTIALSVTYAGIILPYSLLPSLVPARAAGAASGLMNTLAYGANFVYPIALGRVVDATGLLTPVFLIVAAASAGAGLIALRLSPKRVATAPA